MFCYESKPNKSVFRPKTLLKIRFPDSAASDIIDNGHVNDQSGERLTHDVIGQMFGVGVLNIEHQKCLLGKFRDY